MPHRSSPPKNTTLDSLVEIRRLRVEPTSTAEIAAFLNHARQALADGAVPGVSASGRFEFAYTAAHALAFAALRANDLRPDAGPGHRAIVFQSLPHTIGAPDALWSPLNRYDTKRNRSEYGQWVEVTDAEARDLMSLATTLRELFERWLAKHRPQLLR